MKKNLVIAVMFFTGFVFAAQSYGACKRTMNGNVIINYSYKEKGKEYYRKNMVYIDFISAQGIYRHKGPLSTRCNPVSIKKAKRLHRINCILQMLFLHILHLGRCQRTESI